VCPESATTDLRTLSFSGPDEEPPDQPMYSIWWVQRTGFTCPNAIWLIVFTYLGVALLTPC